MATNEIQNGCEASIEAVLASNHKRRCVYTVSIFSQVTGVLLAVRYQEGQLVNKGDPLTDIDDRQFKATLLQAQGALQRDENLLAQAKVDLEHYRAEREAVAKQILDDQEKLVLQDEGTVKND